MSTTPPLLQSRPALAYVAIPLTVSMAQLPEALPEAFAEVRSWARAHGADIVGAPFVRYRALGSNRETADPSDGREQLEIEPAIPVSPVSAQPLSARLHAEARVREGVLPPGVYATLVHTGPYAGLRAATAQLLAWGETNGIDWHRRDESRAEYWEARIESYLNDPAAEPDPAHWQTEIAFLTKET